MDNTVVARHYEIIEKAYPGLNIGQLGMVMMLLAALRSTMGHESVKGTIDNYVHVAKLSSDIRLCIDFLEREILAIKRSKIDIDYWKRGNDGEFRRDNDKTEGKRGELCGVL